MASNSKSSDHLVAINTINRFFANEQGRDKFNKSIQYGARLLAYQLLTTDPKSEWGKNFSKLSVFTGQCRKILGLFKWLNELEKLEKLLLTNSSNNLLHSSAQQLQIIGTLGAFNYWFFDNLIFLQLGGILKPNPKYLKYSMLGFNLSLTCALILDVQALLETFNKEKSLKEQLNSSSSSSSSANNANVNDSSSQLLARQELLKLNKTRQNIYLNFIKNGGDWIVSANGGEIIKYMTGKNLSDPIVGLAGLASGLAVMAQVYRGL